jgi:hypothetical protein
MNRQSSSILARVSAHLVAVLLVAIGLDLGVVDHASAYSERQLTQAWDVYTGCVSGCSSSRTGCVNNCGIFFNKSCLTNCNTTSTNCQNDCWSGSILSDPDSAFDEVALLARNGRSIYISGPLDCPEGGTATIDVTVTHETGAIAGGQAKVQCRADTKEFTATLATNGSTAFPPYSEVKACGTAQIARQGANASAFQWCRDVTLVPEGVHVE